MKVLANDPSVLSLLPILLLLGGCTSRSKVVPKSPVPDVASAAPANDIQSDAYVDVYFLLVASTPSFAEAQAQAKKAAAALGLALDADVQPDPVEGLTFSAEICERVGLEQPCYIARGRADGGAFVSIEYSSNYAGFEPKKFLVIVAHGEQPAVEAQLAKARATFPDAQIKKASVYIGSVL